MSALSRHWLPRALLTLGVASVVAGLAVIAAAWFSGWNFSRSEEGRRAQLQLATAAGPPVRWLEEPRPTPPTPAQTTAQPTSPPPDGPRPGLQPLPSAPLEELGTAGGLLAPIGLLELASAELRFRDPPQPGARSVLSLVLRNRSVAPSGALTLRLPRAWFDSFEVVGAVPAVLDDRDEGDEWRVFSLAGPGPGQEETFELVVKELGEDVQAPELWLGRQRHSGDPEQIAALQPPTFAPKPLPGPARIVRIPRIELQAPVVITAWEPPAFVVGQLKGSANVSQGNTVLIGHLRGLSGNVFSTLDRVELGDEVIAVSRGLEHRFVVSQIDVLENDDHAPMERTDSPRLTLMTCVGLWNPFTQDYSQRLWIVAEPPDQARETIEANARKATARATMEALLALEPTARPIAPATRAVAPTAIAAAIVSRSDFPLPQRPRPTPAISAFGVGDSSFVAADRRAGLPPEAGLAIKEPAEGARVSARFLLKGTRTAPPNPSAHVWLFSRSELLGSRWLLHPGEVVADADGGWQLQLELPGPPGPRHELKLGVVDADTHRQLLERVRLRDLTPSERLPDGFWDEVTRIVATR